MIVITCRVTGGTLGSGEWHRTSRWYNYLRFAVQAHIRRRVTVNQTAERENTFASNLEEQWVKHHTRICQHPGGQPRAFTAARSLVTSGPQPARFSERPRILSDVFCIAAPDVGAVLVGALSAVFECTNRAFPSRAGTRGQCRGNRRITLIRKSAAPRTGKRSGTPRSW
jgi:hypothetical protein